MAEAEETETLSEIINVSTVERDDGSAAMMTTYAWPHEPKPATRERPARKAASERAKLKATRDLNIAARYKEGQPPKTIAADLDCDPRTVGRVIEVLGRRRNGTKVPEPEPRESEAEAGTPTNATGGELVRDCTLTITGLPGAARAYDRALDLARVIVRRQPARAVTVLDSAGAVLVTIDAAHLAAVGRRRSARHRRSRAIRQPVRIESAPRWSRCA